MKRFFTLLIITAVSTNLLLAQVEEELDFEGLNLSLDTFWDGRDLSGAYKEAFNASPSDTFIAYNQFDTAWGGYWVGGFAISTMTNDTTGDYTNLYSSIAAGGFNSNSYAVVSAAYTATLDFDSEYDFTVGGAYFTNSTYAYFSMLNGDFFAKKFGGLSGEDPDYFFIRFYLGTDSLDFYLADFRSSNNEDDYIINDWVYVDFSVLGQSVKSLKMKLFSSDTSSVGINTPAYFCMDNFVLHSSLSVNDIVSSSDIIPSVDANTIRAKTNINSDVQLLNLNGQIIELSNNTVNAIFDTSELPKGIYIIKVNNSEGEFATKVFRW